jgi:hypothetical protein
MTPVAILASASKQAASSRSTAAADFFRHSATIRRSRSMAVCAGGAGGFFGPPRPRILRQVLGCSGSAAGFGSANAVASSRPIRAEASLFSRSKMRATSARCGAM